jgi:hypothetical protein
VLQDVRVYKEQNVSASQQNVGNYLYLLSGKLLAGAVLEIF